MFLEWMTGVLNGDLNVVLNGVLNGVFRKFPLRNVPSMITFWQRFFSYLFIQHLKFVQIRKWKHFFRLSWEKTPKSQLKPNQPDVNMWINICNIRLYWISNKLWPLVRAIPDITFSVEKIMKYNRYPLIEFIHNRYFVAKL